MRKTQKKSIPYHMVCMETIIFSPYCPQVFEHVTNGVYMCHTLPSGHNSDNHNGSINRMGFKDLVE